MRVVVVCFILSISNIAWSSTCDKCKDLIGSFRAAFVNSANNFEGGNTAWEELHQGKYAVSESRLLAITEEVYRKHHEYSSNQLFNQLEDYIEDWWNTDWKDGSSTIEELQDVVCIDKALLCCPINKFGPSCSDCSTCSSYGGYCDGNGTRVGSGLCICKYGYTGSTCNACTLETHFAVIHDDVVDCNPCHRSCSGGCSDSFATSCKSCASGWTLNISSDEPQTTICVDIDECETKTHNCADGEYCSNTDGSFTCSKCDPSCLSCNGSSNRDCISCSPGYAFSTNGWCEDVNECSADSNICRDVNEQCTNTPGSFKCECMPGFERVSGKCVLHKSPKPKQTPKPISRNTPTKKSKSKIIWTVPYTLEVLKCIVVLCLFGVFIYFFSHRIIISLSVATLAVAYVCCQSRTLDAVFGRQA